MNYNRAFALEFRVNMLQKQRAYRSSSAQILGNGIDQGLLENSPFMVPFLEMGIWALQD